MLRYGGFYGPGTSLSTDGELTECAPPSLPVVCSGDGRWSFTHIDDAAGGVLVTLSPGCPTGTYAIVYASRRGQPTGYQPWPLLGAPPPRHVPA